MQTTLKHPVAYKAVSKITKAVHYWPTLPSYVDSNSWDIVPLYTTPPQRKPLTDEQIEAVWPLRPTDEIVAFARAIEAAHGIKE